MIAIQTIVQALSATREEFGNMFLQAQARHGVIPRKHFEAIAASEADNDTAFTLALQHANNQGWLETLINIIIDEGLEDGNLMQLLAEAKANAGDAGLEATTNLARGYGQPDVFYKGYGNGIRWTGKILVDGSGKGTGILIGPHLMLTAWHVVKDLFNPVANNQWEPDPQAATRLQVEFDDFLSVFGRTLQPTQPLRVSAHNNWCVSFSPCHPDELNELMPSDLCQLKDFWDYAIIRLSKAPGLLRRWAAPDSQSVVPRPDDSVVIFQHPDAQPMKVDQDRIAALEPPVPSAVPKYRFLHYANAVGGSSGAPCFDKSFTLFGIHQGKWKKPSVEGRVVNRGIPIARVLEHIEKAIKELPALDPSENPIWSLGETKLYAPVIGTDSFQSIIWRSVGAGMPKVIIIRGARGSGKTFLVDLLSSMLPDGGHLKVTLKSESISKLNAEQLAQKICETAGAPALSLSRPEDLDSTEAVWLKSEVAVKVMDALNTVRGSRPVWLSITDLNSFEIEDASASQLLFLLYEQTLNKNWLRVVLDGIRVEIPITLAGVDSHTYTHRIADIVPDDIKAYFRRLSTERNIPIDDNYIGILTELVFPEYQRALDDVTGDAMKRLHSEVSRVTYAYLRISNRV